MRIITGKAGIFIIICSMFAGLVQPSFMGNTTVSEAASVISYQMYKGDKVKLKTVVKKSKLSAAEKKEVSKLKWKSKKKKYARISKKKIVAVKAGTTKIIGYKKNEEKSITIKVTVVPKPSNISYRMYNGDSVKITAVTNQSKLSAARKKKVSKLKWKSANKKIVKISNKKIVAVAAGTTKVTGYTKKKNGMKSIIIKVTVEEKPALTRTTLKGKVKGLKISSGTAMAWYGIPYGASTGGANRWRAPQPVAAWSGTKNTTTEREDAVSYSSSSTNGYIGTEDCLYVNVYRPYSSNENLPVLVYLHGGGNVSGTANVDFGDMAASMGIVIVSVSFRVGAFGYLSHPALQNGTPEENSGNFTLLDIHEALLWTQKEIATFGGNPSNVTLSGFSCGGRDALMCLISPMMKGLFQKAFIMSGGYTTCTPEDGQQKVEERLAAILVQRGAYETDNDALDYIKSSTTEELNQLFRSLTTAEVAWIFKSATLRLTSFPQGFTDGTVLPKKGFELIKTGNYNRVPIMLGSDVTEFAEFALKGKLISSDADLSSLSSTKMLELLEKGIRYGSMLQSYFYIENTVNALYQDASHKNVYAYRLLWGTNPSVTDGFYSKYVGAYHGQTRYFLLGKFKKVMEEYSPDAISSKNRAGRLALTDQMRSYLKNFMTNGNPNGTSLPKWNVWSPNAGTKKIMYLNANLTKVTSAMSAELYDSDTIFKNVMKNTTEAEYTALTESLWKDRYFMPAEVPSYK
ncbi:MAG: carboxylesterase family protein [Lachnospiraceae bacterium]|nr:carboxylesterase family protein [Lachnospiraceae bacterium]